MPRDPDSFLRGLIAPAVEAGTMARASNTTFWAEMRGRLAEAGIDWNRRAGDIVRGLRSAAIARRTGYDRFARARADQPFTARMAAPDINARSLAVQAVQPQYLVRFDLSYIDNAGQAQTRTVSVKDVWRPGMTVGDVYDAVAEAAEGLGMDYGQGVTGFANLRAVTV